MIKVGPVYMAWCKALLPDITLFHSLYLGYFVCTAEWFRQYTYEVIVPKKLAPPEAIKILEGGNPVVLPPWVSSHNFGSTLECC